MMWFFGRMHLAAKRYLSLTLFSNLAGLYYNILLQQQHRNINDVRILSREYNCIRALVVYAYVKYIYAHRNQNK